MNMSCHRTMYFSISVCLLFSVFTPCQLQTTTNIVKMVTVTEEAEYVTDLIGTDGYDDNYDDNLIDRPILDWYQFLCNITHSFNGTGAHCQADWDTVKCWPPTSAGQVANESCPYWETLNSTVDIVRAYRICHDTGEWENRTDYNHCLEHSINIPDISEYQRVRMLSIIYLTLCCISLLLLFISLFIFYYFKSLQCTRVAIHKNLFFSFALKYIVIILTSYTPATKDYYDFTESSSSSSILEIPVVCRLTIILTQYFSMVNIFWMLNEGIFLTSRIALAVFSTKSNFKVYFAVGWGLPVLFVSVWAVLMSRRTDSGCWVNYVNSDDTKNLLLILSVPQFVAFLLNFIILINIIRILITKLRASHAVETDQVRKAVKATVVLLPLLGVALTLSFWQYPEDENYAYHLFFSVVISTQGMFVAIIYCFLNSEVQMTVKRKFKRIRIMRNTKGRRRMQANPASFMAATNSEVVLPMSFRKKTATSIDNSFCPDISENIQRIMVQADANHTVENNNVSLKE